MNTDTTQTKAGCRSCGENQFHSAECDLFEGVVIGSERVSTPAEPQRCADCGHEFVAFDPQTYDCQVQPYAHIGNPVICGCDHDFHSERDTPPATEAADDLSNCCPYHAQGGFPYSPCRLPDLEAETCTHGIPMAEPCAKCRREAGATITISNGTIDPSLPTHCDHGVSLDDPCEACPAEAADAPPERIWLQRGQAIDPAECTLSHVSTDGNGEVEYISAAAHDAELGRLREALRDAFEVSRLRAQSVEAN